MKSIRLPLICASALFSFSAFGQSLNSFLQVDDFQDVSVTVSNGGLTYDVSLGPNPTMLYNNQSYPITDVFGFWLLSYSTDLIAVHSDTGVWSVKDNNAGPGGIVGWSTNPNTGIGPNESFQFTFSSLNVGDVDQFGFHVRLDGQFPGTSGDTGFATVPEPTSFGALLVGAVALLARRKRMKAQK